jgi:hypothetical protein
MTVWSMYVGHWRSDPIAAFLDTLIAVLLVACFVKYGMTT